MTEIYASEYPLPGGVDQYFDTLLTLLKRVGEGAIRQQSLVDFVFQEYPQTRGSTAVGQYLAYIGRMRLWTLKEELVRLTPEGSKLIERADADPVAGRRLLLDIKRRSILGYDEMIRILAGQTRSFEEIDAELKKALATDWKTKNQTTFRVNWLRSLGYLEKDGGSYRLTAEGRTLAAEINGQPPDDNDGAKDKTIRPNRLSRLVEQAAQLADCIGKAAVVGMDGAELERCTGEAFAFLGFGSQVISGPGNPDVVLTAPLGEVSYRVLIDTKSRANGVVQQNDVNFNALNEHKAKVNADYVVVLGADFAGGNLEKWAREHQVRLLRVEELRQVLLAHAEGVIALDRLESLFRGGGSTDEAVFSELLAESEHTVQAMSLARLVYDAVRTHQDKEGALNAHSLFYILGGEYSIPAIQATIDLLQSDLFGALGGTENSSLYTRLTPRMLEDKLTQLKSTMSGEPVKHL
ncbi:MAG: hypothetical protein ABFD16_22020 [Thermoguttaceae bacterium]